MAEEELGCSEDTYRYLQRLRDHLIMAKIEMRSYERDAEEFRKIGLHKEALRLMKYANEQLKLIRELENEIAELEKQCFGKEKQ